MDFLYAYLPVDLYSQLIVLCAFLALPMLALIVRLLCDIDGYTSFRTAARRADKFIDRHMKITRDNATLFYGEVMACSPVQFQKSWRDYVRAGTGRPSDYFPSSVYVQAGLRHVHIRRLSAYTALAVTMLCAVTVYLLVVDGTSNVVWGFVCTYGYTAFLLFCAFCYRHASELVTYPARVDDFLRLLDRFANMKDRTLVKDRFPLTATVQANTVQSTAPTV